MNKRAAIAFRSEKVLNMKKCETEKLKTKKSLSNNDTDETIAEVDWKIIGLRHFFLYLA
ncbi:MULTISPECIES: hypothetical protein [Planococcus]|uniref:hypothetical protein n=1 Tax=Planococcus TaxID=1372 RepID=UPI001474EF3A|nr:MULTISPECIES: hypothetical protein [Planococcus]MDJ0332920.1 hypothetical protein [Planococcus sp. S3-L1]